MQYEYHIPLKICKMTCLESALSDKRLKIVNKGFVPTKEYQKNSFASKMGQDVYQVIM